MTRRYKKVWMRAVHASTMILEWDFSFLLKTKRVSGSPEVTAASVWKTEAMSYFYQLSLLTEAYRWWETDTVVISIRLNPDQLQSPAGRKLSLIRYAQQKWNNTCKDTRVTAETVTLSVYMSSFKIKSLLRKHKTNIIYCLAPPTSTPPEWPLEAEINRSKIFMFLHKSI